MSTSGSFGSVSQTMNIGGDAEKVTQGVGHGWTVMNGSDDVSKALHDIQAALAGQPVPKALMDAAVKGASEAEPNKPAIGTQLKTALEIAQTGLGWAELSGKLAPAIAVAAKWLGGEWTTLLRP